MPAIDNLTKAVQDVQAENALVIGVLGSLNTQVTALTQQVADLQATLANSGNQDAAIQAAADALIERSCGKKQKFPDRIKAQAGADAHNRWAGRSHDVEMHPCPFCEQWHIGRIMTELPRLPREPSSSSSEIG